MKNWIKNLPVIYIEDIFENITLVDCLFWSSAVLAVFWIFWFFFWALATLWMLTGILLENEFDWNFFIFHLVHLLRTSPVALLATGIAVLISRQIHY